MYRPVVKSALFVLLALWLAACDFGAATPTPIQQATPTAVVAAPTSTIAAQASPAASPTAGIAIAPAWARDSVLYQIFVRNFTPEGTLAAAAKQLPGLKDMGVNLIYLMPIHPIGKMNRKGSLGSPYSVQDYMAIDPALGTEADLKAFVDTAHSLKMHVIMDLVANHTSWDNVLTKEHPDWYKHDASGNFVLPNPDWTDVIQLDYSKPGLVQYMVDMTTHYVRDDGVDGFRCDYSIGPPVQFWLSLRDALKKVNPDVFLLSENDDQILTQAFDATYDQDTYKDALPAIYGQMPHQLLAVPLDDRKRFGDNRLRTRFLENHDHNRVAFPLQRTPQGLRAITTYLLTTDDIPFIENGEEVGITHTISLFDADPIPWSAGDPTLKDLFKKELGIRNANPALQHGDIADAQSSEPSVLAFLRRSPDQQVLAVISFSDSQKHANLAPDIAKRAGKDLESGAVVDLTNGLDMAPYSWRIIEMK